MIEGGFDICPNFVHTADDFRARYQMQWAAFCGCSPERAAIAYRLMLEARSRYVAVYATILMEWDAEQWEACSVWLDAPPDTYAPDVCFKPKREEDWTSYGPRATIKPSSET